MSNFKITEYSDTQYQQIIDVWTRCSIKIEPEDEHSFFHSMLQNPQIKCFVCMFDSKIIGALIAGSDGRYGYIHHLAILPEHQNAGAGSLLVIAAKEFFKHSYAIKMILVLVWNSNKQALAFWEKQDFRFLEGLNSLCCDI